MIQKAPGGVIVKHARFSTPEENLRCDWTIDITCTADDTPSVSSRRSLSCPRLEPRENLNGSLWFSEGFYEEFCPKYCY